MVDAPPVYDPGGPSCVVDDFAVADLEDWSKVGPTLIDAVREWGAGNGATQLVVVVAQADGAKRAVLQESNLTIASEWWVGAL